MNSHKNIYLSVFFVWVSHLLVDFMIGVWPIYKTLAGLDLAIAGLISAASAFAGEGLQLLFGPLCDRGYRKHLLIFGLILACATSFMAYTQNYWILFFLFLTTCIGSGAFHPAAASIAGNLTQKHKALFLALFASGGSIGLAFSQFIFTKSYALLQGNTIFLAAPTLFLIICIFLFGVSGTEATIKNNFSKRANLKTIFSFFKDKQLRLLYIAQVCNQSLLWATVFLLPDILKCRGYESWICFGGGHFFLIIGAALMVIPSGYIADRYSPKKVVLTSLLVSSFIFYLFIYFHDMPSLFLLGLVFLLGSFLGMANPLILAMGNKLRPESPGMISAFLLGLAWCVSEGLGQGGGGLLTKLFENDAAANSLAVLGVAFFIGSYAIWSLEIKEENYSLSLEEAS
ncbi:MFS transporter, aromatic acid:H+ symporter (AAHS) family [Candidatus Rubidus massiliensis]|nr:MFS transporter, aromatic acid:H+ symporter (AAHS) family [Candidatus Rubidus massiliensis]